MHGAYRVLFCRFVFADGKGSADLYEDPASARSCQFGQRKRSGDQTEGAGSGAFAFGRRE